MTTTIKNEGKKIDVLHFEHIVWIKELEFYKNELKVFNKRLTEVSDRYTSTEVLARLEQFQNKFIVQNEVADILRHDLKKHENELMEIAKDSPVAVDHKVLKDHPEMRERMESFVIIYRQLRDEFMEYLSETM
jgi:ATP sulfurylase